MVFAERIENVEETNFGLDLIKLGDCFLDGHGIYDNKLASYKMNTLKNKIFSNCYQE